MRQDLASTSYFADLKASYSNTRRAYRSYWLSYGGARAILTSTYFLLSVGLTATCAGIWTAPNWWDIPIAVLPNLIGFTLGGYAILLAFGDDRFLKLLTTAKPKVVGVTPERAVTPFRVVSSTFMHFLLVEIVGLLLAIVAKSRPFSALEVALSRFVHLDNYPLIGILRQIVAYSAWAIGFGTFLYAICLSMAATAAIFRVAGWFEVMQRKNSTGDQ